VSGRAHPDHRAPGEDGHCATNLVCHWGRRAFPIGPGPMGWIDPAFFAGNRGSKADWSREDQLRNLCASLPQGGTRSLGAALFGRPATFQRNLLRS
jgi:hypothetical protein